MTAQSRAMHRRLMLSAATFAAGLTGYGGRRAYAACVAGTPPTFVCSGANAAQQTITLNDATVSTVPGFSVNTAAGAAIRITGDGAVSYTDDNASPLTTTSSASAALYIGSFGDIGGGNAGSVSVITNGMLVGGDGIFARSYGSGTVSVTANGDVAANGPTSGDGIYALSSGTDLTVTTGAGTTVTSVGGDGIFGLNQGTGALSITANGNVTTQHAYGIRAVNQGTDLTVTTGAGTTVSSAGAEGAGIFAYNHGSGALTITANGDVTTTGSRPAPPPRYPFGTAIYAVNSGTDLTVTTGAGTTVSSGTNGYGIYTFNHGSGALTITANGDVTGAGANDGTAIGARTYGTTITVTTGAGTTVSGERFGIGAANYAGGSVTITANGDVTGTTFAGIYALSVGGGPVNITVGAASHVTSNSTDPSQFGIKIGEGIGDVTIAGTVNGGAGGAIQFDQGYPFDTCWSCNRPPSSMAMCLPGPARTIRWPSAMPATGHSTSATRTGATRSSTELRDLKVESGTWSFSGTTTEPFTVLGGTVMGTGTFGGLTVTGGTIAPGNSIGTPMSRATSASPPARSIRSRSTRPANRT